MIIDPDRGELLVSEFDERALVIQRYEWLPASAANGPTYELAITDWDGEQIARRPLWRLPAPPRDHSELTRLLEDVDSRE